MLPVTIMMVLRSHKSSQLCLICVKVCVAREENCAEGQSVESGAREF